MSERAADRLPALDLLRALAVLAVLGSHFPFLGPLRSLPEGTPRMVRDGLAVWQRAGWTGVDLFFVLSGFLVSGLLYREWLRHGSIDGKTYFVRRGLKIYPAFYVFVAISGFLIARHSDRMPPVVFWVKVLGEGMFLQNYYGSLWNHTWTLAIEEHFYLLLLALLWGLARRGEGRGGRQGNDPFRPMPWIFVTVASCLLALRLVLGYRFGYLASADQQERLLVWTHTRIDSLFFGVVLSYAWHFHRDATRRFVVRWRPALLVVAFVSVLPAMLHERIGSHFIPTFGFTLQYLGFGALLMAVLGWGESTGDSAVWRWLAPITLIGRHSYSIYLWHMVVATFGRQAFRAWSGRGVWLAAEIPLYIVASVAVGVVLSVSIEQPVLRLRERWFPSRSGGGSNGP